MRDKIWVKLFRQNNNYYCYDVTSNNIMGINKALYDILKNYDYNNREEVLDQFNGKYKRKEIIAALATINNFNKEKNGFALRKEIKLKFPFTKSEYDKALKNLLNHLVLNLTEECNFRCKYCKFSGRYSHARKHTPQSMSWETVKRTIDFFIENSCHIVKNTNIDLVLGFYGGEPLLESSKIFKSIEYIKDEYREIFPRFRYSITTNGSLLSKEIIKKLIAHNFTILISLDGPENIHDRYRTFANGKCTYDTVIDKLDLIKQIDNDYFEKKIGFSIVFSPEFYIKEVVDYFRNNYFGKNRVYLFSIVDEKDTNFFDSFDMKSEWSKFLSDERELFDEYKECKLTKKKEDAILFSLFDNNISGIHNRRLYDIQDEIFPNGICLPGLQKTFVDTKGNLHFCEKINWKFSIGNIYKGLDVEKIFFLINEYIKTTNNCKYCWAVRFCKECFLSSIKDDCFSIKEKKKHCKAKRKEILKYLKDYVIIMERNPGAFDSVRNNRGDIINEVFKFLDRV